MSATLPTISVISLKRRDDALGIASGASADLADSVDVTAKFR